MSARKLLEEVLEHLEARNEDTGLDIIRQKVRAHLKSGGWISVEERLPEIGQDVLYYFNIVGMHLGKFYGGRDASNAQFGSSRGFLTGDVTHWQPLPPLPGEKS